MRAGDPPARSAPTLAPRSAALALLLAVGLLLGPTATLAQPMLLGATAIGGALDAALAEGGIAATTSYGASGMLARQIEQGAPADVFVSANPEWMTHLVEAGLVDAQAVSVLLSNRLVVIGPEGAAALTAQTLPERLGEDRFAMADPQTAPVGAYGKAAFEALGIWAAVAPRLVPTRNTLATVAAVTSGEVAFGLVYASDALGRPGVSTLWEIPTAAHPPIVFLIAPLAQGDDAAGAAKLVDYLLGAEAQAVFTRFGFTPVGKAP